jgi:hypothetical protein
MYCGPARGSVAAP